MNRLALVLIVVLAPTIGRADKVYTAGKGGTWDCKKDPVVDINHGRGVYTFQGPCKTINLNGGESKQLAVNGSDNTIDIGGVEQISLNGDANKVTYKKGLSGAKPRISTMGDHNSTTEVN